jgi:hypothetical protein
MCSTCESFEARVAAGTVAGPGAVAQLAERVHGMDEVRGSIPLSSTRFGPAGRARGYLLGGFVAGEGSFFVTQRARPRADGTRLPRFVFEVSVATRDRALLDDLQGFLGAGSVLDRRPRDERWQPISSFVIAGLETHLRVTLPFGELFLLPGAKRTQFESWSERLLAYAATRRPRQRSVCSVAGCSAFVRGRGLCRSHYHRATGY